MNRLRTYNIRSSSVHPLCRGSRKFLNTRSKVGQNALAGSHAERDTHATPPLLPAPNTKAFSSHKRLGALLHLLGAVPAGSPLALLPNRFSRSIFQFTVFRPTNATLFARRIFCRQKILMVPFPAFEATLLKGFSVSYLRQSETSKNSIIHRNEFLSPPFRLNATTPRNTTGLPRSHAPGMTMARSPQSGRPYPSAPSLY